MNLFDLHSDTLYEAYVNRLSPISASTLQAPLGISPFDQTHRLSAIWCSNELDDETCFREYLAIHAYTEDSVSHEGLPGGIGFSYAVEDARLLAGKLERMETLAAHNVKVLTLTWQGISSVGGAWDTEMGLTDFGKAIVRNAAALGLTLDISHASDQTAKETLLIAERCNASVIASHSNSRLVCPHKRNLSDYLFDALSEREALVGISMVPYHLQENGCAKLSDVFSHILHFLSRRNAEKTLAIGSDFDGVSTLPEGISSLSDLPKLYRHIESVLGKVATEAIFYENASRFFSQRY